MASKERRYPEGKKLVSEQSDLNPTVSIIVPVKNGAATVQELLESLMQIDYDKNKLEVIVVDGNSTDDTQEIVSKFPVGLLKEERPGLNAARNTGINHSKGEIIAFTDCDCVVPRNWIKRLTEDFRNPQVGCVGGNILGYYDNFLSRYSDESILPVMRIFKKRKVLSSVKPPLQYPAGCNMAARREAIEDVGGYNENLMYGFDEDELVERICKKDYSMVLDPKVVVKHKHRLTLLELLKQNFQYGRGGGLLSKLEGTNSTFSRWILLCVSCFFLLCSAIAVLIFLVISAGSFISSVVLSAILLLPPIGLMVFYLRQTFNENNRGYKKVIVYPFIDIIRSIAFVSGAAYQLLRSVAKTEKVTQSGNSEI